MLTIKLTFKEFAKNEFPSLMEEQDNCHPFKTHTKIVSKAIIRKQEVNKSI